jgi:hypothetical protein
LAIAPTPVRGTPAWRVLGPLLVLQIFLWLTLFLGVGIFRAGPNGKSLATDFAVFSGAASAVRHGANPYDNKVLYSYERRLLRGQHLAVTSNVGNVRAGNPPWFYWAIQPLTDLPFQPVALAWIAGLFLFSAVGLLAALRYFRLNRTAVPLAIFLLMPQVVLGACYGNIHGVLLAVLALGLMLGRRRPLAAGAVLGLAWLKPQLGLPLVALVILFHVQRPARVLAGFALSTAAQLALTLIVLGPATLGNWLNGLVSWSHSEGAEPNLASLVGLYAGWASYPVRLLLTSAFLLAASALTARVWWQRRGYVERPFLEVAWLWCIWFLAAPFAHFPDEVLLAIPILALLGRDAARLTNPWEALVLYLCFFSLALFPATVLSVNLLSVVVAVIAVILYRSRTVESLAPG